MLQKFNLYHAIKFKVSAINAMKSFLYIASYEINVWHFVPGNMHCQRSDEILTSFFHVKLARIEHVPSKERNSTLLDFQFLESVDFEWSANLHLKMLTFIRAVNSFRSQLKRDRNGGVVRGKGRAIDWRVTFKRDTNLLLLLSAENNMIFGTGK